MITGTQDREWLVYAYGLQTGRWQLNPALRLVTICCCDHWSLSTQTRPFMELRSNVRFR